MRRLSSIFSFDTLTGLPRITASLVLTVAVCAGFRLGLFAASDRLDHIPSPAIFQRYVELEDELIRQADARPKIVLMGNSMARYGLLEDRIAAAAGLPNDEVVNMSIEAGRPWDALVFIRRNPDFFRDVRLVIYNVGLPELLESSIARRRDHYYRFSTLAEKLTADRWSDRALMTLDWLWPYHSDRRDLVTWMLGSRGQSDYVHREGLRPAWEPDKMARLQARWVPAVSAIADRSGRVVNVDPGSVSAEWPEGTSRFEVRVLDQLVSRWREAGANVLLLGMPGATVVYQRRYGSLDGQTRLAQFDAALEAMTDENVAYVAWRAGVEAGLDDASDFMDECHMTRAGARKFTGVVIERLAAIGWLKNTGPELSALSLSRAVNSNR
jgi:hypothetical protein